MASNRKQIIRMLGNALMGVAILFIGVKLYRYREAFLGAFNGRIGVVMLVSALATACVVIVAGVLYGKLVGRICGRRIPTGLAARIYCKSNLYKYIPGNVLQYVGRNQLAELTSARHDQVAFASVIEMGCTAAGALIVSLILSRQYVMEWIGRQNKLLLGGVVLLGVAVAAAVILLLKKRNSRALSGLMSFLKARNLLFVAGLMAFIVANQALNGALFVWLLKQLAGELPSAYWRNIAGVYCFAWLVGFITPGAPGGMGIREALLSVLLVNVVPPGTITVAVIFNRIVTVLGDLLAYPASLLLERALAGRPERGANPGRSRD